MTKTYAVIGDPIDHSLSPLIHNAAFRELKLDCTYIAYRIKKGELKEGLESLKKINIAGFNVTIPHKISIMKYLDTVDRDCNTIGACNTVLNNNGSFRGFNTDMEGFLEPIKMREITIKDSNVLLLGSGGAARAIVMAFAKEKAKSITIANRTFQKASDLAQFSDKVGLKAAPQKIDEIDSLSEYNFVVNATSIGLKNEPSPLNLDTLSPDAVVYDIVYRPMNTQLILQAKKINAKVIYGYEMLLGQAIRSFEIWHNQKAPYKAMKQAILGGF